MTIGNDKAGAGARSPFAMPPVPTKTRRSRRCGEFRRAGCRPVRAAVMAAGGDRAGHGVAGMAAEEGGCLSQALFWYEMGLWRATDARINYQIGSGMNANGSFVPKNI